MANFFIARRAGLWLLLVALILTTIEYWPGLSGSWLFDDYPNIVDNHGVQPTNISLPALVNAMFASPATEFKRPLASLSFAANYLATGLNPYWMKLTNLIIHLTNGILVFFLALVLLKPVPPSAKKEPNWADLLLTHLNDADKASLPSFQPMRMKGAKYGEIESVSRRSIVAALIAGGWLLLPINLTAVLYVVQRMESMANLFVLLGLFCYAVGRQRMLNDRSGLMLCAASLIAFTAVGFLVKETAVMLPLYAFLTEWILYRFRPGKSVLVRRYDKHIWLLFWLTLFLPMMAGIIWVTQKVFAPPAFSMRNFTLHQRLLSETRIVSDYIMWTLFPTPHNLSFYHDDFHISLSLLRPWTTLTSILFLATLIIAIIKLHRRAPLPTLGLALFLGAQLLTGTILPLELIYEHRNYFASLGLLLAITPYLASYDVRKKVKQVPDVVRYSLLGGLMTWWAVLTGVTAYHWGNDLRLAQTLAARAPESPRALYELGRSYIIYSHYDSTSPFTQLAYEPLERAASLPESSILPQQALIFLNARMHLPIKDAWWDSLLMKIKARPIGIQDESALEALGKCAANNQCVLPKERMINAFRVALNHPHPSARLQASYGDYAWNVLNDKVLGERMIALAIQTAPSEPAYRITMVRMLVTQGQYTEARSQLDAINLLNIGGRLNVDINNLRRLLPLH